MLRVRSLLKMTVAMACAALLPLTVAATAAAAPTVSISVGADPVESITTQLGVSGTDPSSENALLLKVKPAGGEACGVNYEADGGREVIGTFDGVGVGAHTVTVNWTFEAAGSYLLCAWLTDNAEHDEPVVASASQTIVVRPPHISLAIKAPSKVAPDQTFQIVTAAQSETSRDVTEYIEPNNGRGCPANAAAASSAAEAFGLIPLFLPWNVDGGPFTQSSNEKLEHTGSYLVCAYAEYPSAESVPEAMALATISVVKPPPPCVVPKVSSRMHLGTIERRIVAAHCTVGKVRSVASQSHRRGTLIRLSPRPGTRRASGAPVEIFVSSGSRRRRLGA